MLPWSNVDFHSFGRWFTTKAERAGQLPHIIDAVTRVLRGGRIAGPSRNPAQGTREARHSPAITAAQEADRREAP